MYKNQSCCRACGYGKVGAPGIKASEPKRLTEVFNLGIQPLANDFVPPGADFSGYAPLKVLFCPECKLGQLSVVVDPKILYRHYAYVTSPSETMRKHFYFLAELLQDNTGKGSVLEIGSNDGLLLQVLNERGFECTGIDPAENLCKIARERGVNAFPDFFSAQVASELPNFDIVIARHVFCHIPNWQDFVKGLELISGDNTTIYIEAPYCGDMLEKNEFDTIYHEHLSYLSFESINALLRKSSLYLHCVYPLGIHGGAVLMVLKKRKPGFKYEEKKDEIISLSKWQEFKSDCEYNIEELKRLVNGAVASGKRVAGLGASAKSTVWINACKFSRKEVSFISDTTPQKQYCLSPGTDIPVIDEGAILRELPDYVIMWCWNFKDEALKKFELAREKGVKFIIPVPRIEVV